MSLIIAADPGLTGAFALLDSYGELLSIEDMPVTGKDVNVHLLADIINDWCEDSRLPGGSDDPIFVIENVSSSPQMGVTSAFRFGRSKGVIEGAAAMADCQMVYVAPNKWKRDLHLTPDKGKSREMATNRWPKHSPLFKRVKDDGRAEAALIGLWQVEHG